MLEVQQRLEMSLKSCKSNEALLYSEIDHLRDRAESATGVDLPEKEKEIRALQSQIEEVTFIT